MLMDGKGSETLQKGTKPSQEPLCNQKSDKQGDQTNTCLVTSSPDHTRKL